MTINDDPRFSPRERGSLRALGEEVLAQLEQHLELSRAGTVPVLRQRPVGELLTALDADRWIRQGGMDGDALGRFLQTYLAESTRLQHPAYMGHQVAVPLPPSAMADLVHGTLNNGMAIYEMGASATVLELAVLDWMLGKVGWRDEGLPYGEPSPAAPGAAAGSRPGGVLTHGGSLANLTALLAARAKACPEAWVRGVPRDLAVLAPATSHYSIARAVSILGLGSEALFSMPVDGCGRVDPSLIEEAYEDAVGAGRRVIAVVANAVSTPAGVYDPLPAIADFCEEHQLWLHVDGAHGASALLSPIERLRLTGIERAQSVVWDAHKLLGTSTLCAAVLVREVGDLLGAFRQQASYLVEEAPREVGVDLLGRAVECTKASLGLKLFLNLAVYGEAGLARQVEELHAKARSFARIIAERPGFAVLCTPEANIVCFRVLMLDDAAQARLRADLVRQGDFYITQADVGGRRWLRLVLMNPLTDEAVLEQLLRACESIAANSRG
ncbi:MAG: pyridoxal phosphate-dependent decarboxylase family protein [Planctomycetota bacterium]